MRARENSAVYQGIEQMVKRANGNRLHDHRANGMKSRKKVDFFIPVSKLSQTLNKKS